MKEKEGLVEEAIEEVKETSRVGYGKMDGSMKGFREGGRGRNRTFNCRLKGGKN